VTAWQWVVTALIALGGVVVAVAKADLEDPDVYRWLARRLVYRAALHLPRGERARWREQAMGDVLALPGRLPPLLWAVDTYVKAGSWGRTRGAPSRWQALMARIRVAWQWLRPRPQSPAQPPSPSSVVVVKAEEARARVMALDAQLAASGTTRSGGSATLSPTRETWATFDNWRYRRIDLDTQFVAWLAQERRAFEDDIDRKVEGYRRARDQELGL
jgi:hypothetical protein